MRNNIQYLRKEIVAVGKRAYKRGYVASNDGNISSRINEKKILITPTGVSKGFIKPEDLIVIDIEGNLISGKRKMSSECHMHLQIYKNRPDVKSVCHLHPPYATGFAVAGISLDEMVLPEVIISLGTIPVVEYGATGTPELYQKISSYINEYDAFLLANHGALTVGHSVISAYHKMETLEHASKIYFIARQLGNVNKLSKEQTDQLIGFRAKLGIRKEVGLSQIKIKEKS